MYSNRLRCFGWGVEGFVTFPFDTQKSTAFSINCKDVGDPVCNHIMYVEREEELLKNIKEHGIEEHGYTEKSWNEILSKNPDV